MFLPDPSHHLVVSEQLTQLGHIRIAKAFIVQAAAHSAACAGRQADGRGQQQARQRNIGAERHCLPHPPDSWCPQMVTEERPLAAGPTLLHHHHLVFSPSSGWGSPAVERFGFRYAPDDVPAVPPVGREDGGCLQEPVDGAVPQTPQGIRFVACIRHFWP